MTQTTNLGIIGYDGIRFVSLDLERSRSFYIDTMDFALTAATTPAFEDRHGYKGLVFSARNIQIEVIESTRAGSTPDKHLKQNAAGICAVNFLVKDIEATRKTLVERGATFLETGITTVEADGGSYRTFEIVTPLGNTTYGFVQRTGGYKGYAPGYEARAEGGSNKFDFAGIDHLTSNMRTLKPYIDWCKSIMGMEEFWRIDFHTSDVDPTRTSGSGLKSIVVRDPESGIKFANNEPAAPFFNNSQIQFYLEDFGGAGVQHAAFGVRDILAVLPALRERGARFLNTPGSYYDAAPARMAEQGVAKIDENWDDLRATGTLIDGKDGKYLLQIFMEEAAKLYTQPKAGPFFIELIQRKGDPGFGGGNFRALFESIEREQADRIAAEAKA
jgi:4-hydroxyphenylpyruvate dioxygenase